MGLQFLMSEVPLQESKKFNEEDIEEILQRRSTKVPDPETRNPKFETRNPKQRLVCLTKSCMFSKTWNGGVEEGPDPYTLNAKLRALNLLLLYYSQA